MTGFYSFRRDIASLSPDEFNSNIHNFMLFFRNSLTFSAILSIFKLSLIQLLGTMPRTFLLSVNAIARSVCLLQSLRTGLLFCSSLYDTLFALIVTHAFFRITMHLVCNHSSYSFHIKGRQDSFQLRCPL